MVWSIGLLAVLIGLDQALKYWTVTHLALGESAELIPGFLQLTRLHNYGAAWSSLSGKVVVLLFLLGGGLGNMIDRVLRGYVVDMLDISPLFDYPIFNLADCFVVVGAVLGAVYYLWFYDKYDKKERTHGHKDPDGHN